jgi:NAD+ kinase
MRRKSDIFYYAPSGGESLASLCLRIHEFLDLLELYYNDQKVVIVTHSETIWAFRIIMVKTKSNERRIYQARSIIY